MPRTRIAIARCVLALFVFFCAATTRTPAEPAYVTVGPAPILRVQLQSGNLTIHTWNRAQVQIDTQGRVNWQSFGADVVASRLPTQIPAPGETVHSNAGLTASLPYEVFQMPPLSPGGHAAVLVNGSGDTTITVPNNAAFIFATVGNGSVALQDYRGAFFTSVRNGGTQLRNVGGTGFVQVLHGPIAVYDSSFDRLRVRNGIGNVYFGNSSATQIEVTGAIANIVYDRGSFTPGLARFETLYGNVALGVGASGAEIDAHSGTGRVLTSFSAPVTTTGAAGDTQARVGSAAARVTASSQNGAVLLYDGTLDDHPALTQAFPGVRSVYRRALATGGLRPLPPRNRPIAPPARSLPANRPAPPPPAPHTRPGQPPQRSFVAPPKRAAGPPQRSFAAAPKRRPPHHP